MSDEASHVLRFDDVTKRFEGERAVDSVSFDVESGERVAIVGPSGAGKTTLLRLANGSLQPDDGSVTFDGAEATSEDVALAYQGETLIDRRTALANVLSGRVGGLSWWRGLVEPLSPRNPEPALELLDAVGLREEANARADELSAGERQRVAFARALIRDAPAVLADEPTANLDPATRSTVIDLLQRLTRGRLLVTVLHDTGLARDRFDRIVGVRDGRIAFDEPASELAEEAMADLFTRDAPHAASDGATDPGSNLDTTADLRKEAGWYG